MNSLIAEICWRVRGKLCCPSGMAPYKGAKKKPTNRVTSRPQRAPTVIPACAGVTSGASLFAGAIDRLVDPGEHLGRQRAGFGRGDAFGQLAAILYAKHHRVDRKRQCIAMRH